LPRKHIDLLREGSSYCVRCNSITKNVYLTSLEQRIYHATIDIPNLFYLFLFYQNYMFINGIEADYPWNLFILELKQQRWKVIV
jgi:hypothetical protein